MPTVALALRLVRSHASLLTVALFLLSAAFFAVFTVLLAFATVPPPPLDPAELAAIEARLLSESALLVPDSRTRLPGGLYNRVHVTTLDATDEGYEELRTYFDAQLAGNGWVPCGEQKNAESAATSVPVRAYYSKGDLRASLFYRSLETVQGRLLTTYDLDLTWGYPDRCK